MMRLKKIILSVAVAATFIPMTGMSQDAKMEAFITDLMSKMTLKEKIGQLNLPVTGDIVTGQAKSSDVAERIRKGEVGGLFNLKGVDQIREVQKLAVEQSRLKIPLIFGMDVIHGYETVFPIPLGISMTWDMEGIERSARVAAQESSADGICWTFSPMVDVCRDARWGRMSEGNGEDPYLGAQIAKAMVRGYQGDDLKKNNTIMACVKHFALYGGAEAGRDYNTVDMSHWRMFNYYFPPYKAAIDAGAGSIMTSFNVVDGIPASGNQWLMTEVLRNMWKFNGFVVTDYTAISEMMAHGLGDLKQVSALALNAGTDMDMVSEGFLGTLQQSIKEGKVSEQAIDLACRRILEAKYKLGLFDNPYKYLDKTRAKKEIYTKSNRQEARNLAAKSFVLLKNDGQILPLKKQGKIALIGPLAHTRANMPGTWSVAATFDRYKSLYEAMKDAVGTNATITYAKGSNVMNDEYIEANGSMFGREIRDKRSAQQMIDEALQVASNAEVIVAAIGETSEMSGESSSRSDISLPDAQRRLLTALKKTGKPVVLVNFSGRSTDMTWESNEFPSILNVWFGGSEAGDAICDVLFGDKVPSGHLSVSMPKSIGQVPIYYNHLPTGRPLEGKWFQKFRSNYLDVDNEPLYPFGFGLSYTTFSYSPLSFSSTSMTKDGAVQVSVTVTNTGKYDADEVVQLYIRDLVGSVSRPVKELKDFQRINIKTGEAKQVIFTINANKLKFYNSQLEYVCEPGEFEIMIGPNSRDVQKEVITLK